MILHKTLYVLLGAACCSYIPVARASDHQRDAIVKIYTIQNQPDYYNPWSMRGPRQGTGSGAVIKGRKILTNAHVVSDETFIQVRRNGAVKKYVAHVAAVCHQTDLALLEVDDESFYEGIEPLELGTLPESQQEVLVYGFPLGGDTMSITKGVVSRIEHQTYAHSSGWFLAGQIDAAINPGNSGGPVLVDGKVVGVVMQSLSKADNIGYMVPVNLVDHFLEDLEDGVHHGYPSLGVLLQDLESPSLRDKHLVPDDKTGLLINGTVVGSPAENVLLPGDIILEVDGYNVEDNGTVEFRPGERTSISYVIQEHQVGETLDITVLRGGEAVPLAIPLTRRLEEDWLVPQEEYDVMPTYYICGGIVFAPLTKNFLQAWGNSWYNAAPKNLVAILSSNYPEHVGEEVVIILKVLAADVNQGYHNTANWVVKSVNGKDILNLRDLVSVVESTMEPFLTFKNELGQEVVLNRELAESSAPEILGRYRVPADRSEDLVP